MTAARIVLAALALLLVAAVPAGAAQRSTARRRGHLPAAGASRRPGPEDVRLQVHRAADLRVYYSLHPAYMSQYVQVR